MSPTDRESWKEWIWGQYTGENREVLLFFWLSTCVPIEGGFLPGPFVSTASGGSGSVGVGNDDGAAQVRIPLAHFTLEFRRATVG